MAKKKKKGSKFYPIYWTVVLILLAAIAGGLVFLNGICAEYEGSLAKYVAQPYIDMYEKHDIAGIVSLSGGYELKSYESQADYVAYVEKLLEGKTIVCKAVNMGLSDLLHYQATADGAAFSEFTLRKGEPTEHGFDTYVFNEMTLDAPVPERSCTVRALNGYTVYVEGNPVDESAIVETNIDMLAENINLPASAVKPYFNLWKFPIRLGTPQITVRNSAGEQGELIADDETGSSFHMVLQYSDAAKKRMNDQVLEAVHAYCTFISEDTSKTNCLRYVAKGSQMEKYIMNYDNSWFTPHKRYIFSNEYTYNYYPYAQNCFSCDVQLVFTITSSAGKKQPYPFAYRFYFGYSEAKQKWQVFDFETIDFNYEIYEMTKGK